VNSVEATLVERDFPLSTILRLADWFHSICFGHQKIYFITISKSVNYEKQMKVEGGGTSFRTVGRTSESSSMSSSTGGDVWSP